jgi:hypothetical protein
MPESTLVAAVRDRVWRADGSTPTHGLQLGQQLDTAREQSATQCKQSLYLRRMSGHRSAQAPSNQRLRGAMLRSRRYRRLRAHVQSLSQMPIPAPVNTPGGQVSRNITNSGTGRPDGLRAPLRRTVCTDRRKIAFSSTEGPMQWLLGIITENAPRKVTGPRRRLGNGWLFIRDGSPLKNMRASGLLDRVLLRNAFGFGRLRFRLRQVCAMTYRARGSLAHGSSVPESVSCAHSVRRRARSRLAWYTGAGRS